MQETAVTGRNDWVGHPVKISPWPDDAPMDTPPPGEVVSIVPGGQTLGNAGLPHILAGKKAESENFEFRQNFRLTVAMPI